MLSKEFGLYLRSSKESLKNFNLGSDTFISVLLKTHSRQGTSEKTIVVIHLRKLDNDNGAGKKQKMQGRFKFKSKGCIRLCGEK